MCIELLLYTEDLENLSPLNVVYTKNRKIHPIQHFLNTTIDLNLVARVNNAHYYKPIGPGREHFIEFEILNKDNKEIYKYKKLIPPETVEITKEEFESTTIPKLNVERVEKKFEKNNKYYKKAFLIEKAIHAVQERFIDNFIWLWRLYRE